MKNKKQFLLVLEQEGNGCDYTIGCGISIQTIWADSKEGAIAEINSLPENWQAEIDEDGDCNDILCDTLADNISNDSERKCSSITLYEISSSTNMIPEIKKMVDEVNLYEKNVQDKIKEKSELEQYKKLKKKFEK